MALLENEDNFGFEASPSFPSIGTDLARVQTPIDHSTAAEHTSNRDRNGVHRIPDANASDNEGLSLDLAMRGQSVAPAWSASASIRSRLRPHRHKSSSQGSPRPHKINLQTCLLARILAQSHPTAIQRHASLWQS